MAEIGVAFGDYSDQLLRVLSPLRFDAYDVFRLHEFKTIWGRKSQEAFHGLSHREFYDRRFADEIAAGQVEIFEGDSSTLLANQLDGWYNVIYIDGDHQYEGVLRDAEVAVRKLAPSGHLIFNDYIMTDHITSTAYGVVHVVNDLCVNQGWRVHYLALDRELFCDVCLVRRDDIEPDGS